MIVLLDEAIMYEGEDQGGDACDFVVGWCWEWGEVKRGAG